jgi:hypothetical protein
LVIENRQALAQMKVAQDQQQRLESDIKDLRTKMEDALKKQEAAFRTMVDTTNELHTKANLLTSAQRSNKTLQDELARFKQLAERFGWDASKTANAPPVEGHVVAVSSNGTGLVEVSVGSDHGLAKGHELEVYRANEAGVTYVGRIQVVTAEPDKAVCKILPNFLKGTIQKDDNVTSLASFR